LHNFAYIDVYYKSEFKLFQNEFSLLTEFMIYYDGHIILIILYKTKKGEEFLNIPGHHYNTENVDEKTA